MTAVVKRGWGHPGRHYIEGVRSLCGRVRFYCGELDATEPRDACPRCRETLAGRGGTA